MFASHLWRLSLISTFKNGVLLFYIQVFLNSLPFTCVSQATRASSCIYCHFKYVRGIYILLPDFPCITELFVPTSLIYLLLSNILNWYLLTPRNFLSNPFAEYDPHWLTGLYQQILETHTSLPPFAIS
jgi:hypothetical protein